MWISKSVVAEIESLDTAFFYYYVSLKELSCYSHTVLPTSRQTQAAFPFLYEDAAFFPTVTLSWRNQITYPVEEETPSWKVRAGLPRGLP